MGDDPQSGKDGITVQHHEPDGGAAKDLEKSVYTGVLTEQHLEKSDTFIENAIEGNHIEHNLKVTEAARIYWKAVVLTGLLTLTIIMRGYDSSLCGGFFGLPAFQKRFGKPVKGHGYQVPANWQSAIGVANTVGQVFGSLAVTYPMEMFGRRKTLLFSLCCTACIIPMEVFAPSIQVLTAGQYILGFVAGFYQVLIPTYVSELLPTILRPYIGGLINVDYNLGGLLIAGVTAGFDTWTNDWAYKIPFAIQWGWIVIIVPVVLMTPESPWWLVRHNKTDEARKALRRLISEDPRVDIDLTISMMQKTTLYEEHIEAGSTFMDCFRGPARHRTEIMIMIFFSQDFLLSPLSAAYFYEQLNFSTQKSFDLNIGSSGISVFCSILAAFFLRYSGRRKTWASGVAILILIQMAIGFLQLPPSYNENPSFSIGQVTLLFLAGAIANVTTRALTYGILTEIPSLKLRSKSVAISIATDAICGIVTNFVTPYLINPGEANAKGKVDFLWGGISIFSFIWCFFRLPETKGRTYEEIDYLFENKVPTRKFASYVIEEESLRHNLEDNPEVED